MRTETTPLIKRVIPEKSELSLEREVLRDPLLNLVSYLKILQADHSVTNIVGGRVALLTDERTVHLASILLHDGLDLAKEIVDDSDAYSDPALAELVLDKIRQVNDTVWHKSLYDLYGEAEYDVVTIARDMPKDHANRVNCNSLQDIKGTWDTFLEKIGVPAPTVTISTETSEGIPDTAGEWLD